MKGPKAMLWTLVVVAGGAAAARWLDLGGSVLDLPRIWRDLLNAATAAALVLVVNWCAPWVDRYGIGAHDDA